MQSVKVSLLGKPISSASQLKPRDLVMFGSESETPGAIGTVHQVREDLVDVRVNGVIKKSIPLNNLLIPSEPA